MKIKHMKRFVALFAALALVLAMAAPAFADEPTSTGAAATGSMPSDGKITVQNAIKDDTYSIYRIFDLVSFKNDETGKAYSYKLSEKWAGFTSSSFSVNKNGYIEWKGGDTEQAAAAFAVEAKAYIASGTVKPDETKKATGEGVEFDNLQLGYYLVSTSVGSLCSLDTTDKTAEIKEKNSVPSVDKVIVEDNRDVKSNNAGIGDKVNYKVTINVTAGNTSNYVLHDTMTGLDFNNDVKITSEKKGQLTSASEYTVNTAGLSDSTCTFEIVFDDSVLVAGDTLTVEYSGTVNASAVIGGEGNKNESHLQFGNKNTPSSETKTYVWKVNVHKYTVEKTGETEKEKALAGAKFVLSRGNEGEKEYAVMTGNKVTSWKKEFNNATVLVTDGTNDLIYEGLDAGNYQLIETEAPTGYNKLKNPIDVVITASNGSATITYKDADESGFETATGATVKVLNNAGTTLPGTGGIGTTIFYLIGGGLMVAAAVLLIAKKRMENK